MPRIPIRGRAAMIAAGAGLASTTAPAQPRGEAYGTTYGAREEGVAAEHDVVIEATPDLRFDPAKVTIRAGDTVAWRNTSSFRHTVTLDLLRAAERAHVALPANAEPFHELLRAEESYRRTFTVPGTYKYVCTLHENAGMTGTIVVEPRD